MPKHSRHQKTRLLAVSQQNKPLLINVNYLSRSLVSIHRHNTGTIATEAKLHNFFLLINPVALTHSQFAFNFISFSIAFPSFFSLHFFDTSFFYQKTSFLYPNHQWVILSSVITNEVLQPHNETKSISHKNLINLKLNACELQAELGVVGCEWNFTSFTDIAHDDGKVTTTGSTYLVNVCQRVFVKSSSRCFVPQILFFLRVTFVTSTFLLPYEPSPTLLSTFFFIYYYRRAFIVSLLIYYSWLRGCQIWPVFTMNLASRHWAGTKTSRSTWSYDTSQNFVLLNSRFVSVLISL